MEQPLAVHSSYLIERQLSKIVAIAERTGSGRVVRLGQMVRSKGTPYIRPGIIGIVIGLEMSGDAPLVEVWFENEIIARKMKLKDLDQVKTSPP